MKSGKNDEQGWTLFRRYANLGIELVVAVLLGAWGGHQLDRWLDTSPWLLLIGFFFGAAAGILNIFKLIASEQRKKKNE
ncbi:MAG: AtpZ/AtpI family protein [Nitrospiria bacterium]